MAATQPAINYVTMLRFAFGNINSLNEAAVVLRNRLDAWRLGFFPLLDTSNPEEAKIHAWTIPSLVMSNSMDNDLTFSEVADLAQMLSEQIAALAFNGYVNPSIEAACVAAYNAAWT